MVDMCAGACTSSGANDGDCGGAGEPSIVLSLSGDALIELCPRSHRSIRVLTGHATLDPRRTLPRVACLGSCGRVLVLSAVPGKRLNGAIEPLEGGRVRLVEGTDSDRGLLCLGPRDVCGRAVVGVGVDGRVCLVAEA